MYFLYFLLNKVVEQVVGGSVINGATMYKVYNTIYNIQYGDLYKVWINNSISNRFFQCFSYIIDRVHQNSPSMHFRRPNTDSGGLIRIQEWPIRIQEGQVRGGSVAVAVDVSEGWQETQDMSHVKCDTWHIICNTWHICEILIKTLLVFTVFKMHGHADKCPRKII